MVVDEAVLGALAEARALGFLGPGPLDPHLSSAAAFADAIRGLGGPALDLGTGGGVPGLVLASVFAEISWTLLDANRRRTSFLARTVSRLGWVGRVDVVRAAAEEAAHDPAFRGRYAVVVARSFGPPATTAEIAVGFLRLGGHLVVAEPPAEPNDRWPAAGLASVGLERRSTSATGVASFALQRGPQDDVPRPWRTLSKHPRW